MRYRMTEKIFSFGDDFTISDENGNPIYHVDGKVFTIGNKLSFQDMNGRELAHIQRRLLSWGPTYEITRGGVEVAVVKKHLFTLFRCKFTVDIPGPDDLEAAGSFLEREYTFTRGGAVVAQVSKKWFSWSDSYCIDVNPGEDDVLILASAIVIDQCCHPDGK